MGMMYGEGYGFWWALLKGGYFVLACFVFSAIFWKMQKLVDRGCCKKEAKPELKQKKK
ncbi:MAG: hypothetical protein V1729_00960 [Candidatus Woesearchaeota archaeon]